MTKTIVCDTLENDLSKIHFSIKEVTGRYISLGNRYHYNTGLHRSSKEDLLAIEEAEGLLNADFVCLSHIGAIFRWR